MLPYGSCCFASKAGQLAASHFLTITEGRDRLRRARRQDALGGRTTDPVRSGVRLERIAATSEALRATRARTAKAALLADAIRELAPDEIEAGVAFLSGELRQRQIGAGWASLRELPAAAAEPSLTVARSTPCSRRWRARRGAGIGGPAPARCWPTC